MQSLQLSRKSSASSTGSLEKSPGGSSLARGNSATNVMGSRQEFSQMTRKNLLRHDEQSMKSVRDKIALFSTSKNAAGAPHHQSSEDVASAASASAGHLTLTRLNSAGFLTRAYTHGDVRMGGESGGSSAAEIRQPVNHRSMTNVSGSRRSIGSPGAVGISGDKADLMFKEARMAPSPTRRGTLSGAPKVQGRSQSLMEIGSTSSHRVLQQQQAYHSQNQTLPKRQGTGQQQFGSHPHHQHQNELQKRRNTVAKLKDIPIPETCQESPISSPMSALEDDGTKWIVARTPDSRNKKSHGREPVSKTMTNLRRESTDRQGMVSPPTTLSKGVRKPCSGSRQSSRSSIVSPVGQKNFASTEEDSNSRTQSKKMSYTEGAASRRGSSAAAGNTATNPIAKHQVEQQSSRKKTSISEFRAIEAKELSKTARKPSSRQDMYESTKSPASIPSLGKPASRSSSFTIAERKKSFESMSRGGGPGERSGGPSNAPASRTSIAGGGSAMGSQQHLPHYASQDSLSMMERRTSRDSAFEGGGGGSGMNTNMFSSVSSIASTVSRRSSRDTICEETAGRMTDVSPAVINSRRSSRSEADGGSRVTTPTKTTVAASSGGGSTPSPCDPVDRSASVTPTEKRSSVVFKNENPVRNTEQQQQPPSVPRTASRTSLSSAYSRSTSVVSKDSGFTEDTQGQASPDNRWSALEKKYSSASMAPAASERPRDLGIGSKPSGKRSQKTCESPGFSPLPSPGGGKSIRELTEKFECQSPDGSTKSPLTTPTAGGGILPSNNATCSTVNSSMSSKNVELTMTSTSTSRRESMVKQSNVEEFCSASFRVGEMANNFSWLEESMAGNKQPFFFLPEESSEWESFDPADAEYSSAHQEVPVTSSPASAPRASAMDHHRKFSVPVYSSNCSSQGAGHQGSRDVKMREKKDGNTAPSRPSSLIETTNSQVKIFEMGHLGDREHRANTMLSSSTNSQGSSQADLLSEAGCGSSQNGDTMLLSGSALMMGGSSSVASGTGTPLKSPALHRSITTGPSPSSSASFNSASGEGTSGSGARGKEEPGRRCVSVNDIRRAFEKAEQSLSQSMAASSDCGSPSSTPAGHSKVLGKTGSSSSSSGGLSMPSHNRMSSLDSTTSEESSIPTPHYYGSVSSLLSGQSNNLKDHYGSISSLASSTSLISPHVSTIGW